MRLPGTPRLPAYEDVFAVIGQIEPCTTEEVRVALGNTWEQRGTIQNRVRHLHNAGLIIGDEGRPQRWAINELGGEAS